MIALRNATVLRNGELEQGMNVLIDNNVISKITKETIIADQIIDCSDMVVAAGYIDIHTHGGYLHDVMEGTRESIAKISEYHLKTGTTTYLPTTLTAGEASLINAINNVRDYIPHNKYSRIWGIHLEGPFFTMKNAGAQPPRYLIEPNDNNIKFIINNNDIVKRISIAPDVKGIIPYVKIFTDQGIQVSGGHDNSVSYEIYPCIENGMNSVTHTFNCTSTASRRPLPHKYLGLTETCLIDDRLYAEAIVDNRHIPFPQFRILYKMKGWERILLVSDSLSVAGMGEIKHYLGKRGEGYEIEVKDSVAVLPALNTYAGSVTPIAKMVEILINDYNIPINEAVSMGTLNQAKLLGMVDRGDMVEGYLADINILSLDGKIEHTIFNGELLG